MKVLNSEVIYKYDIQLVNGFEIEMPEGARILSAQVQHGEPKLWAVVNPSNETKKRAFRVAGTGHQVNPMNFKDMVFIDTIQLHEGDLVFHIFEITQ